MKNLADKVAVQLNDTHPAVAVAELMRLLMDLHGLGFKEAWDTTRAVTGYTNHTLLPEALESWPVHLFERLLPRHMQIVYAINAKVIAEAQELPASTPELIANVSLIDENNGRRVRMGNLAFAGSHSINGVSGLHSSLMKVTVFRDLNTLYPGRINNKTNGITPRRWLKDVNPELTGLLREAVGDGVLDDAALLSKAVPFAKDASFRERFAAIKRAQQGRARPSGRLAHGRGARSRRACSTCRSSAFTNTSASCSTSSRPSRCTTPCAPTRTATGRRGSRSSPAKRRRAMPRPSSIIKLINDVARVVNNDPGIGDQLKVVFLANYNVSLAEVIVPAADLSEQISTAGMEASGTGNMKFAMNGALTIGTLDGANVEISEHVGHDNIFIFGLKADEVEARRKAGIDAGAVIEASPDLKAVIDALSSGVFSPDDPGRYRPIIDSLYHGDWFLVASDFDAYAAAQREVDRLWHRPAQWTEKAILNTANSGWFSSDRTIREYAKDIWNVPVP